MLCSRIGPQIWGIPCDSVPFLLPPPEMSETPTGAQVLGKLKEYRSLARMCANQQNALDDNGQAEDAKLLGNLVCVKISIVRAKGPWHILRLAMRLYFHSLSSEAIAEFAGSVMRYLEKRHAVGNPPSTATLIRAVRLRAAGVRGDVGDMCFVHRAMEYHFGKCMLHRVRFFVTSRILASRQAEDEAAEWEDAKWLGSSKVISTIRKKFRDAQPRFLQWLQDPCCIKANHIAKQLPSALLRHHHGRGFYNPDELDDSTWQLLSSSLPILGLRMNRQQ